MKPRPSRYERKNPAKFGADPNELNTMLSASNSHHRTPGTGDSATSSQCAHMAKPPEGSCQRGGDVHIQLSCALGEACENPSIRHQMRPGTHSGSHPHSHGEARGPDGSGGGSSSVESEEQSGSSFPELAHLFHWLHKSLPYLLILSIKLLMQHIIGISLGIGLLTTFIYANKSIVNQVFLRERCSKLQCAWLLVFLTGSSLLLYYAFSSQSLHYSLILLSPTADFASVWEVLWIVGITDFILKFFFMSLKCIVLLVPFFIMSFKSKGYWYMLLEEVCQHYRRIVPVPVWFRYLIGLRELNSALGRHFGIFLALLYLILKLLSSFEHLKKLKPVLRIFYTQPSYGIAASKRQCAEADDLCSICQAEFQKPVLLVCQHIFCEECINLWFNREKTCPLCRALVTAHVNKWKDGATAVNLQIY